MHIVIQRSLHPDLRPPFLKSFPSIFALLTPWHPPATVKDHLLHPFLYPNPNPSPPQPGRSPRVAWTCLIKVTFALSCGWQSLPTQWPSSFLLQLYYNLTILFSRTVAHPVHPSAHTHHPVNVGTPQGSQGAPCWPLLWSQGQVETPAFFHQLLYPGR